MGPPTYMRPVLDQNVIMPCKMVQMYIKLLHNLQRSSLFMAVETDRCINRINMGEANTA